MCVGTVEKQKQIWQLTRKNNSYVLSQNEKLYDLLLSITFNVKDASVFESKCNLYEAPKSTNKLAFQRRLLEISRDLFFDLISVSAGNSNLQNYKDANERIILIAFKLIAGYSLLI